MQKITGYLLKVLSLLGIFGVIIATGQAQVARQNRIVQSIDSNSVLPLKGSIHPLVKTASDAGLVDNATMLHGMTLNFKPSDAQEASLSALLKAQQDPNSPSYHQWLTQKQFGERFGMSQQDIAKVSSWLQAEGFSIDGVAATGNAIYFSGSVATIEKAFHTQIHKYSINGETHFANGSEVALPGAFASTVLAVRGLDDFKPKPHVIKMRTTQPDGTHSNFTSGASGLHFLSPKDFATIYDTAPLIAANITGAGVNIGVMGQTDIVMSDVTAFRAASGLTANNPTVFLVPGSADPGVLYGDLPEADLDVEWSGGVAPGANIIFVNSTNVLDSLLYAIKNPVNGVTLPILSSSYGNCEPNFAPTDIATFEAGFQQANSQGQTILSASGDSGAADCDYSGGTVPVYSATQGLRVDYPASSAYVTGLGGTSFTEGTDATGAYWTSNGTTDVISSAKGYIPEATWNDTAASVSAGTGLSAGGGGMSLLFVKPTWQTGVPGIPSDGARDVPDVALNASPNHDGYLYCTQTPVSSSSTTYTASCVTGFRFSDANKSLSVVGGTSAAAPSFAGIVALISQKVGGKLGNINPSLYALASDATAYASVFHDVTAGDNLVPCTIGAPDCPNGGSIGFAATTGYDQVTGLGSVDASHLATALARTATTTAISVTPASPTVSTAFTLTATVAPAAATGTVSFSIDGGTPIVGTVTGGVASVTSSVTTGGLHTFSATYVGDSTNLPSSSSGTFNVVPPTAAGATTTTVSANPTTVPFYGSTTLTATVQAATTGTVTFTIGNAIVGTAPVTSNGTATLVVNTVSARQGFVLGANTITATYGGDLTHGSSAGTAVVTVVNPSITLTATNVTIASASAGQSGNSTITVTSVNDYIGTVNLTATVTSLVANGAFNPTSVKLVSGASGTSTLTITTIAASLKTAPTAHLKQRVLASRMVAGGGAALGCILLFGVPAMRRKRWTVLSSLVLFSVLMAGIGCGGGGSSSNNGGTTNPGTAAGTYTVTVTGTDSLNPSVTASASLTVVIK